MQSSTLFALLVAVAFVGSAVEAFAGGLQRHVSLASLARREMVKQEIQDLNLEEMFDVFEKADKTVAGAPATSAPPRPSAPKTVGGKSASVPYLPAPKNLDGYVGNKGFDPIGFSDSLDVRWLREAELKHGRIGKFDPVLPLVAAVSAAAVSARPVCFRFSC